jgi:RNA polymerase sigma factor (sigma-70 family)
VHPSALCREGPATTDDATLVRRARRGDRAAFAALADRHYPLVVALCRRVVGDTVAEDAAQEAVLVAMLRLDRLRRPDRFGPWVAGIGLNLCRLWLRDRARTLRWSGTPIEGRSAGEPLAPGPDPVDLAVAADLSARVRAAVGMLPPGQRAAVLLFYLGGLSHAEVSAALAVEPGAVKARLHKARRALRGPLQALWSEERPVETPENDEEETMATPTTESQPVDVAVDSVRVHLETGQRVIVLGEVAGDRVLTIWVGNEEADQLVVHTEELLVARPGPYELALSLVRAGQLRVLEAVVERLADEIMYATLALDGPSGRVAVDARPSDALNLALRAGAPIRVRPELFAAAGKTRADVAEWDKSSKEPEPPANLTPRAARVLARARGEEPRPFNHTWVGTEHVLLALARADGGVAAAALAAAGVDAARLAGRITVTRKEPPTSPLRFTPAVWKALAAAADEAKALGHDVVGTGHLLLGVLREQRGFALTMLTGAGANPTRLRDQVLEAFARDGQALADD